MSALLQKNNRKLKETITVKKAMKSTMVFAVLATIVFTILYRITENGVLLSLAITAGTISYHFVMRYTVAGVFSHTMHNRANLSRKWYQQKKWEKKWLNHKFCGISDSSRSSVGSYRIASERNIRHQDIRIPVCEES